MASIHQTKPKGQRVARGDELGYFGALSTARRVAFSEGAELTSGAWVAYGGSTIVVVFPKGTVEWNQDLLDNSEGRNSDGVQVETLVKVRAFFLCSSLAHSAELYSAQVGEEIGRWVAVR